MINLKEILEKSAEEEKVNDPLLYFIRLNDMPKVKELLANGANPNKKGDDFRPPLALAFALRNLECAQILLDHGANPDLLCGRSPISFMAYDRRKTEDAFIYTKKCYDMLKQCGADFTLKNDITQETLEERFSSYLPSQKFIQAFK